MNGLAQLRGASVQDAFVTPQMEQNALLSLVAMRGQQPGPAWERGSAAAPAASQGQWDMGEPIIEALLGVESSSSLDNPDWDIRGPVVPSGAYAGQQAIGPAQIMPGNIPSWSEMHVGQRLDPEELARGLAAGDPQAQDAYMRIVRGEVARRQRQGYGPAEIASIWHSGTPGDRGAVDTATALPTHGSGDSYINRFMSHYRR